MTRPVLDRLEATGAVIFCMAFAACPIMTRPEFVPAAVLPADVLTAMSALLCVPSLCFDARRKELWQLWCPVLPLLAVTLLSALASGSPRAGAPDVLQLVLYGAVASYLCWRVSAISWGVALLRVSAVCALAVSMLSVILHKGHAEPLALLMPAFLAALLVGMCSPGKRWPEVTLKGLVVAGCVAYLTVMPLHEPVKSLQAVPELRSPIDQRYLEAYAAATVLAKRPLLGLGPGNYQAHIGEYYQSLPKDNTLVPGTQVGYAVTAASTGILGLAALLFWMASIEGWLRAAAPRDDWLFAPLVMFALCVCFTPPVVSPMLMGLAVLHGLAWGRARLCG